jgi:PAS domain-containing protein
VLGEDLLTTAAAWALRNGATTFVLAALALRLLDAGPRSLLPAGRKVTELVAAVAILTSAYALVFAMDTPLPLSFLLIPLTLWIALRFDATVTAAHVLLVGTFVVWQTLGGLGPFAGADGLTRVVLAQGYVAVLGVVGLALSLLRDERQALVDELAAAHAASSSQAALLGSLLDTVQTTVLACDADGRPLYVNRTYVDVAGGAPGGLGPRPTGLLRTPDGTPLPREHWPLVRALRGEQVAEESSSAPPGVRARS